jgi:hypothetical protein
MNKIFIAILIFMAILFVVFAYFIFSSWSNVGTQMIKQDRETINSAKQIEKNVLDLKKKNDELFK